MDTAEQTLRPSAKCGVLFRNIGQRRSCSMDQQLAQVLVSSLADPHESWLAAGRRLTRNQAQPCRKIATMFESLGLANGCNQSRRNRHADTRNRYQSPSIFVLLRPAYELRIKFSDSPIKFLPLGANVGNQRLEEIARAKALDCDTIEIWRLVSARRTRLPVAGRSAAPAQAHRVTSVPPPLHLRCGMPEARQGRSPDPAGLQYRSDEPAPRGDRRSR